MLQGKTRSSCEYFNQALLRSESAELFEAEVLPVKALRAVYTSPNSYFISVVGNEIELEMSGHTVSHVVWFSTKPCTGSRCAQHMEFRLHAVDRNLLRCHLTVLKIRVEHRFSGSKLSNGRRGRHTGEKSGAGLWANAEDFPDSMYKYL